MNTVKQNQMERRKICKKYQWFIWYVCVLSHFSYVQLFVTPWTVANQAPLSMGFSSKDTGVGCHSLLQGIFPTQGSKLHLLHWQVSSLSLGPPGKPLIWYPLVLFTQEYIDELSVLKNTLAHKASPDCGLCKRLLRMDQFSLEMVAKKKYWEWQNIILISKTPSHFSIVKCVCVMSCCCSVNPSCLSLCNPWIKGVYSEKRNGQIQRHEIKVKKRNE